jgi:hypothetical protein
MTSAEMKIIRRMAKYTLQGYKTNEDILSSPKINPVVNKIQNYINKLVRVRRMDRDRQTDCHTELRDMNRVGSEAKNEPSKDF